MKSCPFCAEEIQDAAVVCKHCGRDLAPPPRVAAPKKGGSGTSCLGAAGIAIGAVFGFFLLASILPSFCAGFHGARPGPAPSVAGTTTTAPAASSGNPTHDALLAKSDTERAVIFAASAGGDCPRVTRTFFQGMTKERGAFWNIACSNGRSFSLLIQPDAKGSVKSLDCKIMKAVARTECFKAF